MDTVTIKQVFEAILEDDTLLDGVPVDLVEDTCQLMGFYLLDRDPDIEELDFHD